MRIVKKDLRRYAVVVFTILISTPLAWAQGPAKREFRAAWVASVANIDWPVKKGLSVQEQKQSFANILDEHKASGMNAVIVQVRPTADTFYPSANEPWSEYLTGTQGEMPGPYYNPLAFMIEEAHKRNLEFHAWFNPYRANMRDSLDQLAETHPLRSHPEWFVHYGTRWYYNPGIPEVKDFVIGEIMEVVRHYDIDAVHFDDYFYPYKVAGTEFPDSLEYQTYGAEQFEDVADWRRDNVNVFVKEISEKIKKEKPFLKFGISPFGVWRNKKDDPEGSDTNAYTNYDGLYADVLLWMKEGWIDYVVPQLYWKIGHRVADYDVLARWWNEHDYGRHIYIGHGLHNVKKWEATELSKQLELNKQLDKINGSAYFSSKWITGNVAGVQDSLKSYYNEPALMPVMSWLQAPALAAAPELKEVGGKYKEGITLKWEDALSSTATYYAVYRAILPKSGETPDFKLLTTVRRGLKDEQTYTDHTCEAGEKYVYALSALNRSHHESAPQMQAIKVRRWWKAKKLDYQPQVQELPEVTTDIK
ncbi:glycoside hydrolase family 10 protein [Algivirga pacifica]|uniref:Glycoside hydrolase family 10 protein n=1 Tax=Algivirga pacifica TaxID=1162670 RepID=A0ABP9DAN1_9BACT